jgi:hypothetical protein
MMDEKNDILCGFAGNLLISFLYAIKIRNKKTNYQIC